MLQLARTNNSLATSRSTSEPSFLPQLDVLSLVRSCYKQWPLLVGGMLIGLLLGGLYVFTATPRFTASFLMLVDTSKDSIMSKRDAPSDRLPDPGLVDSQVEILKSDSVLLTVVRELKLTSDSDFMSGGGGLVSNIVSFLSSIGRSSTPPSRQELEKSAAEKIGKSITVKRLGVTYVIQVDVVGRNPETTTNIANAISDAYTTSELESRYQATTRAGRWLQGRLRELSEQSSTADFAVQKFKAENNIVDTSRGLMSEQQLADVNTQLITAHAATAEAKARLDRITEVSNSDIVNATVADALKSDIISRLRAQYLDLAAKKSELAGRYGKDHQVVQKLAGQMNEIAQSAREELRRLAEGSRSDYQIALARENSIRGSMDTLVSQAGTNNKAQVQLRNLESSAQTFRNLYDSFLQKFEEATHEQSFPISNARVITPATVPEKPSSPKMLLALGGASFLGLMMGFGTIVFKEAFGNVFRTPDEVRDVAGLECLGTLPDLARLKSVRKATWSSEQDPNILGSATPVSRYSILQPFSRFTETIRNVKISVDLARGSVHSSVTGIVSSVPQEGKTTFSANLALLTAQMGHRTLLIDGDMHSPSLTKTFRPDAQYGLIDVLNGECALADALVTDSITGLEFLPTVVKTRKPNSVALLTSPAMLDLLAHARETYEYIFVDLPPIVPVVDVKAACNMFDNFTFVISWGRTSRDVVRDALLMAEQVRHRIIGVILNRADPVLLKRIESYRGESYGNYYTDADAA